MFLHQARQLPSISKVYHRGRAMTARSIAMASLKRVAELVLPATGSRIGGGCAPAGMTRLTTSRHESILRPGWRAKRIEFHVLSTRKSSPMSRHTQLLTARRKKACR